jgi:hypothetical protein
MNTNSMNSHLRFLLTLAAAATLSACGKESFQTISTVSVAEAPGYFTLAPKVDILLAQDNTGSMSEIYSQMGTEVPRFLSNLAATGWDYHFASIPLTSSSTTPGKLFSQIVASRQDRNWGQSDWLVPFPGALFTDSDPSTIAPSFFRRPSDYSDYRNYLRPSNVLRGLEPGLETIHGQLAGQMAGTGFHRDDAMLVILVVGNGDDTSGRKICRRLSNNGTSYYEAPCDYPTMSSGTPIRCGSSTGSLADGCRIGTFTSADHAAGTAGYVREYYKQQFQALRPNPEQVRLHAAISFSGGTCYGAAASAGAQYDAIARDMKGNSQNICTTPASVVLSTIQNSLETQRLSLFTVYLTMASEPDTSTIEVIKYVNGDIDRAVTIPKSDTNGWSYAGRIENEPSIVTSSGVAMNRATGWAVQLNGSARLSGSDTARVNFKPRGLN